MNYTGATNAGGGGARFDMDGENALGFYWGPWTDAGEIEEQDERMAQLTLSREARQEFPRLRQVSRRHAADGGQHVLRRRLRR